MKTRLILGIIVVIVLGVLFVNIVGNNFSLFAPKSTVTIDGHTFHVTVATTQQAKENGLSNTSSLPKDQGMLFSFTTPGYYEFWMRNMKYPLDIIYIAHNKIVSIAFNVANPNNPLVPLPIYKPNQPADTVLEINGGLSTTYHIQVGDTVSESL